MSNNATSTPETGQILAGKYLVEEVLGIGGMGVVVAAKHIQLDQKVAIKYLLPAALLNPEVVERFAREARAAAKIRGEHVARVIDVGQFDDGAPYMIMEHLEGHDLAKHLELHGPLPFEDAVRFLLETCEALAEAHGAKIVHRDLKPSNMFLSTQPDKSAIIKVLDFGISKTGDAPTAALTKTSSLMGTCFYMSPEQLTNPKGVDHRSDIWSLGIILYELLGGKQPFLGESIPEIIGAILSNEPEPLRTLRPDVSAGLEEVIAKCMQSKAAARYQSVAELAAALGPFAHARDRQSIEITARVLGEILKPAALPSGNTDASKATMMLPSSPNLLTGPTLPPITNETAAPASSAQVVVNVTTSSGSGASGPAVAAVTTHAMTTSAITEKPKRSPVPMIAGAVGLVLVLAGGGFLLTKKGDGGGTAATHPSAPSTGLVALPATEAPPVVAPTSTTTILPAAAAVASVTEPSPNTQRSGVAGPRGNPAPRASVAPAAVAAPVKSAALVASAVPVASPSAAHAAASAAPASSTKSNPLQMGIK